LLLEFGYLPAQPLPGLLLLEREDPGLGLPLEQVLDLACRALQLPLPGLQLLCQAAAAPLAFLQLLGQLQVHCPQPAALFLQLALLLQGPACLAGPVLAGPLGLGQGLLQPEPLLFVLLPPPVQGLPGLLQGLLQLQDPLLQPPYCLLVLPRRCR
jgi:hypothetical protein